MNENENDLADWHRRALELEKQFREVVVGQEQAIQLLILAVFARGHVLLEGPVGVGKTTLLRAMAKAIGGQYERIEGTIDLMPADLIYYTYLDEDGRPRVEPGPIVRHGEQLSIFFFNEINRARPQVHSLLLRIMAERSVSAFNREIAFPHLQVFADRNRVEKEETFELPAAAKDRFFMEIAIEHPQDDKVVDDLMFNPRYHDVEALIGSVPSNLVHYARLNSVAETIQQSIHTSPSLRKYARELWRATHHPEEFGIQIEDADMERLVLSGLSPRGMSFLIRAARVRAWLKERDAVLPEDIQQIFQPVTAHRLFLNPIYQYRQAEMVNALIASILRTVPAP
ncbi:MAG: MoxR family ATPase [Methylococcaceae bacterium]|nr:MoxR family ATPase [Methylococcaceae bacterium]